MFDIHRNNGTLIKSNFPTHNGTEWELEEHEINVKRIFSLNYNKICGIGINKKKIYVY